MIDGAIEHDEYRGFVGDLASQHIMAYLLESCKRTMEACSIFVRPKYTDVGGHLRK